MPHHHDIEHAHLLVGELILTQLADTGIGIGRYVARAGLEFAGQDLHEGRFAAAVGADQAIAMAVAEGHGDVFEQGFGAELDRQICG